MPFWDSPILIPSVGHPDMTSLYLSRYVYIYIYKYTCICIYIYIYLHVCMYIYIYGIFKYAHLTEDSSKFPYFIYSRVTVYVYVCIYNYIYTYIYLFIYLLNYLFIHVFIYLFTLISCDIYILHHNPTLTGIISPLFCCVHLSTSHSLQTQTEAENSTAAPAPFR